MVEIPEGQLAAELEAFLEGQRNLSELEHALEGRVTFERPGQIGVIRIHRPLPVVPLKSEHLLGVLGRALGGTLPRGELTRWAAAVLVLDCFDLEGPGANQDSLSATVWDLANAGAHDQLTPTRMRELIDRVLDAAP
jgi:hypothetical protein